MMNVRLKGKRYEWRNDKLRIITNDEFEAKYENAFPNDQWLLTSDSAGLACIPPPNA
jgi:hypothetical protein